MSSSGLISCLIIKIKATTNEKKCCHAATRGLEKVLLNQVNRDHLSYFVEHQWKSLRWCWEKDAVRTPLRILCADNPTSSSPSFHPATWLETLQSFPSRLFLPRLKHDQVDWIFCNSQCEIRNSSTLHPFSLLRKATFHSMFSNRHWIKSKNLPYWKGVSL